MSEPNPFSFSAVGALARLVHSPHARRGWLVLAMVLTLASCAFAFEPNGSSTPAGVSDKVNHIAAFCSMGWAWLWAWPPRKGLPLRVAFGLLVLGIFIELVQTQIPSRSAEVGDVVADMVGATAGIGLAFLLRHCLPGTASAMAPAKNL